MQKDIKQMAKDKIAAILISLDLSNKWWSEMGHLMKVIPIICLKPGKSF